VERQAGFSSDRDYFHSYPVFLSPQAHRLWLSSYPEHPVSCLSLASILVSECPFLLLTHAYGALDPIMFTKDRYVFMTLPSWLILAAMAIEQLVSQTRGLGKLLSAGVVVMLLAEAGGTNMLYYHVNNGGRRDWRAAFEIMKEESRDGDVFVAWWPEFSPYYLGREIIPWNDIHPDKVLESGKRYWFLVDSETIWGNSEMHQWIMDPAELIEVLLPGRSRGTFACRSRAGFWSTFGRRPGSNFRFCFWSSPSNRFGGSFSRGLRIALTFQKGDYFGRKIALLSRVEVTQMQRSNAHTNDLHLLYYQEDE
jgi:hypothetical protein